MKKYSDITFLFTFALIFAFGGFLHVFFYGVDWTTSLFQLYYSVAVLLWGISIRRRIIEKRTKRLLLAIVLLLILFYMQQAGRYAMFNYAPVTERYIWYAYYIIYSLVPCLFLQVAIDMNRPEGEKRNPISYVI